MFKNDGIVGVEQQLDTTGTKAVKKIVPDFSCSFFSAESHRNCDESLKLRAARARNAIHQTPCKLTDRIMSLICT